ncbi:MAG: hypothetical protein OXP12_07230 [Thaumarchaeota archaeon]|nr:hypothetical protein [Nitrososphaerota archaeon]MDE0266216.1 hypothetical protein [Nitrososphaerota archaeon]MDE0526470.1 hypothetical protein [Nitrososphaerota archaeon]
MVEPSEVLIFRDYSGWEEPALATPFGFMSLRNVAVLGVFGLMSAALYWIMVPDNVEIARDWTSVCTALLPLGAGAALGVIKTPYGTADVVLLAVLSLLAARLRAKTGDGNGWTKKMRKKRCKTETGKRSKVLGFPRRLDVDTAQKADRVRDIPCADLDELKSIRVTIHGGDGAVLGNRLVRCYLDDELVDALRTSAEGALVLHVRPEREGPRILAIREHAGGAVLLRRTLRFVRSAGGSGGNSR